MKRFQYLFILPIMVLGLSLFLLKDKRPLQEDINSVTKKETVNKKLFSVKKEKYSEVSNREPNKLSEAKSGQDAIAAPLSFSYNEEVQKVRKLEQALPQSKNQLIAIVIKPDPFNGQQIKPHTFAEIQQNKMGAVKVLALKALMNMKDQQQLNKNLDQVISQSKDPVIFKIAKAAKESLGQGRSLFDDFPDAIQAQSL